MSDRVQIEELYGHLARAAGVFAYRYQDEAKWTVAGTLDAAGLTAEARDARARETEQALGAAEGEAGRLRAALSRARKEGDPATIAELRSRVAGARAEARRLEAEAGAWRQAARAERACGLVLHHIDGLAASARDAAREGALPRARARASLAVALETAIRGGSIWESLLDAINAAELGVEAPRRTLVLRSAPLAGAREDRWSWGERRATDSPSWHERPAPPPHADEPPWASEVGFLGVEASTSGSRDP